MHFHHHPNETRRKEDRITSPAASSLTPHFLRRRVCCLLFLLVGSKQNGCVCVCLAQCTGKCVRLYLVEHAILTTTTSVCRNREKKSKLVLRVIQIVVFIVSITLKSSVNSFVEFAFSTFKKKKWSFSFRSRICLLPISVCVCVPRAIAILWYFYGKITLLNSRHKYKNGR